MSKSKEVYLRTALSKLATVMVGGTAFLGLHLLLLSKNQTE